MAFFEGRSLVQSFLSAIVGLVLVKVIYNIFFHPLASFPGPLLRKATRIPWTVSLLRNRSIYDIDELHRKYGPVVRTAPNELSFLDANVWRDIMGGGNSDIPKWSGMYGVPRFLPPHIQNTTSKEHHRILRKALSPGFSDASLRAQEPMIQNHITALISRLRSGANYDEGTAPPASSSSTQGTVYNLEMWYRYVVFDVICDLALGESLDCINSVTIHPWIKAMESAGGSFIALIAINMYPTLAAIVDWLIGSSAQQMAKLMNNHIKPAVNRRLAQGDSRPDLVSPLIRLQNKAREAQSKDDASRSGSSYNEEAALEELMANSQVIIGAGAETTATTLAAVTSLLLDNPSMLERVQKEVRGAFSTDGDITSEVVSKNLPYLCACLDETMRIFPTTGAASLRMTDRVMNICGTVVPQDTVVGAWTWSLYRSKQFWTDAEEFHPERWLNEDPRYEGDSRELFKPFFTGSRDCIGQNLAIMELRLILARMIYNFDMEFADADSREWSKKQSHGFFVWMKTPLNVRLTPRP
ncbi:isotrichodermin C-15 hydroxylase [Microdochium trichocladiopsis]|uniref:Isotrichodermin C-15 hydroxylase n=1 Tax=Microdochium trichocladiopsis TaxID=1682393 RepID=A0A9P9BQ28_9PEZI|nr:isotrichodermin C-15 hydroxylase [Microdochium trichocladiopsis]KAH7025121.1 isotrichodermin C-15 hydroxylase [Microdochium trichocladiopsis]